jgi:hypothetical protein
VVHVTTRRDAHKTQRAAIHAARESAYCRRLEAKITREYAHEAKHSAGWWKWYWSPKQVAKRKRKAAKAIRRERAYQRREKAYLKSVGRSWIKYPSCPDTARNKHKAQEKAARKSREAARKRKRAACRAALAASAGYPATASAKAAKSAKARKSAKAASGRSKC